MRAKKIKKVKPEYSFLGIEIIKFDVIADASINYEVRLNSNKASGDERVYSKTLIASRLRIELETFSRALKNLRDEGINVNRTHVPFIDIKKRDISFVMNVLSVKIVLHTYHCIRSLGAPRIQENLKCHWFIMANK